MFSITHTGSDYCDHAHIFYFVTGDRPSLTELLDFPYKDKTIDILELIGTNYVTFGTFLLDDKSGTIVSSIEKQRMQRSHEINKDILDKWIAGKGLKPVTWNTLVKCLRTAKLHILADDIEAVLQ